jgi:two-component system chemotaxis sensor kinase CheA
MNKNFDHFQTKFKDEAIDNINDLEQSLLELEYAPKNQKLIERIFRVMHSLKGSGAMFGFIKLSEFTHKLENIYDLVREGKLEISSALLSVTLDSVDLLRNLLDTETQNSPENLEAYKKLEKKLNSIISDEATGVISQILQLPCSDSILPKEQPKEATYYISFFPNSDVQKNGTRILYLLNDIKELGDVWIHADMNAVPQFRDLNPLENYVRWNIFLSTQHTKDQILDIFIFVEDQSLLDITQLAQGNLLNYNGFKDQLTTLYASRNDINLYHIKSLLNSRYCQCIDVASSVENGSEYPPHDNHRKKSEVSSSTVRVPSAKIETLVNLVSELVVIQERLGGVNSQYEIPELKWVTNSMRKLISQLRDNTFSISLVPIQNLVTRFQRLVRDLSRDLGKKIAFTAEGIDTELDKSIIETLTDPLMHILRNCADHGIESPEIRMTKGKPEKGTINLNAYYAGANVMIEIFDDGQGINPEKIKNKAIEKGLITGTENMTPQEILELVFVPGLSTASEVTEVSGRGVGMDVVKRKISSIRGTVSVDSSVDKGTKFVIKLPLVLSIVDTLLVSINNSKYVLPLLQIEKIEPVTSLLLEQSFSGLLTIKGEQYPFLDLRKELSLHVETPKNGVALTIVHPKGKVAFLVDSVSGQMQAVIKPLGSFYASHKFISAATIMGDGSIALMLDPNAIVEKFL